MITFLHILANPQATNFAKVSWVALFISGACFFLLGVGIGWLIWRKARSEALRIESENNEILEAQKAREEAFAEHRERIKEFGRSHDEEKSAPPTNSPKKLQPPATVREVPNPASDSSSNDSIRTEATVSSST